MIRGHSSHSPQGCTQVPILGICTGMFSQKEACPTQHFCLPCLRWLMFAAYFWCCSPVKVAHIMFLQLDLCCPIVNVCYRAIPTLCLHVCGLFCCFCTVKVSYNDSAAEPQLPNVKCFLQGKIVLFVFKFVAYSGSLAHQKKNKTCLVFLLHWGL